MKFRPCIDIHNGQVKQIVGGTLQDQGDQATENFVSKQDAAFYANLYKQSKIKGGHIILLNPMTSPYYAQTKQQAVWALQAYPEGLQIGGGITDQNAKAYIEAGASHVIVTSFVFQDGNISYENLKKMVDLVGKEHLVLDLSCRCKGGEYYIVTDRWQKFTNMKMTAKVIRELETYCDEFLIHAVDVEGKSSGIEVGLVKLLGEAVRIPTTYAGGIGSFEDLVNLKKIGNGRLDVTIGSALDLFGGSMDFQKVLAMCD